MVHMANYDHVQVRLRRTHPNVLVPLWFADWLFKLFDSKRSKNPPNSVIPASALWRHMFDKLISTAYEEAHD